MFLPISVSPAKLIALPRFSAAVGLVLLVAFGWLAVPAAAQRAQQGDQEKPKIPPAEDMTLNTKDGVLLRCTFYPGTRGKQAVPIIMLHGWEGRRNDYDFLAHGLQRMGHAVMVPDLRGHGESLTRRLPNGDTQTIQRDRMRGPDFNSMLLDVEAAKKFLMEKNNAGELNIELLCIVGADLGALVGLHWAVQDWNWMQLPSLKQGQDVKALVLLSPMLSFQGMQASKAIQHPVVGRKLPVLIVAGKEDRRSYSDARRVFKQFERFHEPPPKDPQERLEKQTLFFAEPETSLQGTDLLTGRGLRVNEFIVQFIAIRLVNKQDEFPWADRSGPLGG